MRINPTRTRTVTIPWGYGDPVPQEHRGDAQRIGYEVRDAETTASQTLRYSEKWQPSWTFDLDPSPNVVLRKEAEGEEPKMLKVVGEDETPREFETQQPSYSTKAKFNESGELQSLESFMETEDGSTESLSLSINSDQGTLTYTITETGEFAVDPPSVSYPSSPESESGSGYTESRPGGTGPDDVYDEFDNGRRDGGPDSVYDEFDNRRGGGSYFDGPDGRSYYDPF